jgi:phospholipid transport system substrate-binding protein
MKNKLGYLILLVLWGLFSIGSVGAESYKAPQELVETATEDVLAVLREMNKVQASQKKAVSDKVVELILPHLDFVAMSKLVLAKHWRSADAQQRERFVDEFRDLLVRTYETSLMKFRDEKMKYLPFHETDQPDKKAIVRVEVIRSSGPSIPMHYKLRFKESDGWKVYDIVIEGISLVTNYRSSFSREVSERGIDHLIASLQERNNGDEQTNATQNNG